MAAITNNEIWKKIEQDFIFGVEVEGNLIYPSYRFLGEKYNTSKTIINDHSKSEGWELKRESMRNKTALKVVEKKIKYFKDNADKRTDGHNETDIPSGQVTQIEIDEKAEVESKMIMAFDVACAQAAQSHLDKAITNLQNFNNDNGIISPGVLLNNIKVAKEAQELYKNAIGERMPNSIPFLISNETNLDSKINELLEKRKLDEQG